jgi:hypothetical protein
VVYYQPPAEMTRGGFVIRGWNKDSTFASEGISRQLERFGVMASDLDRAPSISAIRIRIPASFFSHTEIALRAKNIHAEIRCVKENGALGPQL